MSSASMSDESGSLVCETDELPEQAEREKIRILKHKILRSFRVMVPMTFQLVGKIDTLTSCELISESKKKVQKKIERTEPTEEDSAEVQ